MRLPVQVQNRTVRTVGNAIAVEFEGCVRRCQEGGRGAGDRSSALGTDVELSLKSFMLPRERPGCKRSMMVGQYGMLSAAPFSVPALPMASDSSELASFKTRFTVAGVV
jgi:hypothetical protein